MRFRLIPRDEGFYPLFEQQAARAAETAVQLELLMRSLPVVPDQSTRSSPRNAPATR